MRNPIVTALRHPNAHARRIDVAAVEDVVVINEVPTRLGRIRPGHGRFAEADAARAEIEERLLRPPLSPKDLVALADDVADGVPHLRVENRLLAAGPTVADTMANAAFYYGLVRALAESERPLWSQMSFSTSSRRSRANR